MKETKKKEAKKDKKVNEDVGSRLSIGERKLSDTIRKNKEEEKLRKRKTTS